MRRSVRISIRNEPGLLEELEAGEPIELTLRGRDMSPVVTSIEKE